VDEHLLDRLCKRAPRLHPGKRDMKRFTSDLSGHVFLSKVRDDMT
jgi:hypothetical protein